MSKRFNLLQDCHTAMLKSQTDIQQLKIAHSNRVGFWPAAASIEREERWKTIDYTVVEGSCLRQSYYSMTSTVADGPTDPSMIDIWDLGSAAEEIYKQRFQSLENYRVLFPTITGEKLRFQNPTTKIRGEADLILEHKYSGTKFGVEMKSYYGFWGALDLCGYDAASSAYGASAPYIKVDDPRRTNPPFPKIQNLLQTVLYLEEFRRDKIDLWKMIYVARDRGPSAEFDVTLEFFDNELCGTVNGVIIPWLKLSEIHKRYATLEKYLLKGEPPPRDYIPDYNTDFLLTGSLPANMNTWHKVKHFEWRESLDNKRESAKTSKKKSQIINSAIGVGKQDWQCRFCPFLSTCISDECADTF